MFCPNCGTKIDEGAVFCPECGSRIAEASVPAEPAVAAADDEMTVSLDPETEAAEQLPEEEPLPAASAEDRPEEAREEGGHSEPHYNYEQQPEQQFEEQPAEQTVYQQEEPPVYHEEQPVYQQETQPQDAPPVYPGNYNAPEPVYEGPIESPAVKLLKKSARSGAFLIAILLFTISVGLTILTIFQNRITTDSIDDMIGSLGISSSEEISKATDAVVEMFGGTIESLGNTVLITSLLAMVPAILTMIALWIIFGSALGKNNEKMGTAGFTIIKVIWIIKLVLTAMIVLAVIVLGIVSYTMAQGVIEDVLDKADEIPVAGEWLAKISTDLTGIVSTVFWTVLGIFAAVSAVIILFQVKIITTLGAVQRTAETGDNRRKVSAFLAVMLFICAFYALHGLPAAIVGVILLPSQLFSLIAICAEIGSYICFGIAIFSYRVKVRILNVAGVIE